jgi:hypothetical protein
VYQLLAGQLPPDAARMTALELEALRASYDQLHVTELLEQVGGIPKSELAMYWAFPTHTSPVAELNPATGAVPSVVGDREMRVAVKGTLDPATLTTTTLGSPGTVTLLDLTAFATGNLMGGLPPFTAAYEDGAIVLRAQSALLPQHRYGIFLANGITDADHRPLVASPASFLLSAHGTLVSPAGQSQVAGVSDAEAAMLEAGRAALAPLFDNPAIPGVIGVDRASLAYVFAFTFGAP